MEETAHLSVRFCSITAQGCPPQWVLLSPFGVSAVSQLGVKAATSCAPGVQPHPRAARSSGSGQRHPLSVLRTWLRGRRSRMSGCVTGSFFHDRLLSTDNRRRPSAPPSALLSAAQTGLRLPAGRPVPGSCPAASDASVHLFTFLSDWAICW